MTVFIVCVTLDSHPCSYFTFLFFFYRYDSSNMPSGRLPMGFGYLEDGSSKSQDVLLWGKLLPLGLRQLPKARPFLIGLREIMSGAACSLRAACCGPSSLPPPNAASLNSRQEGLFNFQPTSRGLSIVIIH